MKTRQTRALSVDDLLKQYECDAVKFFGRLAACFIDSLATLQMPAMGYGLRYDYGVFRQEIENGYQVEHPDNWLRRPDPWEVARPRETVEVNVNATVHLQDGVERLLANHPSVLLGMPFDRPVVGYGGKTINTLRLWEAGTPNAFDFGEFSSGDFVGAVHQKLMAENLTYVLYPDDSTEAGRGLWFAQEYFLVVCSLADDAAFVAAFPQAKRAAKVRFADWLRGWNGQEVDPDALFDCQIKRIHEYKRQLLNVLHIIVLYHRLRDNPHLEVSPRTCFFAGKAAPAYRLAKLIIKLIGNVADVIDADPAVRSRLNVLFLPEYNVSLAERLIPASDVSEQISTAGYEASGTSNIKFMMNGALTVGTRDGATIEMAQEAGEENFFLFGLTAEQVQDSRGWYNPHWHYDHEPETRAAPDMIRDNAFSQAEPGIFTPIWDVLLTHGDYYRHLVDLSAYIQTQEQVRALYMQPDAWVRKAILNVGHSGKFSSDRTIAEYAAGIWQAKACPVE